MLISYDFSSLSGVSAMNLSGSVHNGMIYGVADTVSSGGLHFTGASGAYVEVGDSSSLDAGSGMTFTAVFKKAVGAGLAPQGVIFYKPGHLVFSHEGDRLYANFYNGHNWTAYVQSGEVFSGQEEHYHHVAMVIKHHYIGSQGEDWTDVRLYFDGRPVASERYEHTRPQPSTENLVIGKGLTYSGERSLAGELASIQIYEQALTEQQIQELVLKESKVRPGFDVPVQLNDTAKTLLSHAASEPAIYSALHTLACTPPLPGQPDWKKLAHDPSAALHNGTLILLENPHSTLVLIQDKDFARIVSWYDRIARREILNLENVFFHLTFEKDSKGYAVDQKTPGLISRLQEKPRLCNDRWTFTLLYSCKANETFPADFEAQCNFTFAGDRLEYDLNVQTATPGTILAGVTFPSLKLNPFREGCDRLLVPIMSGVEMPNAVERNVCYASDYPRGYASMQMAAYYDDSGAIYCAMEDPLARAKNFAFSAGYSGVNLDFNWCVAFDAPDQPNGFESKCRAAIELYRGDWYEAGMLYRKGLKNSGAMWWQAKRLPEDMPAWLQENTLWMRIDMIYRDLAELSDTLKKLRNYLNLPFAIHLYDWYERGSHLTPLVRVTPRLMEDVFELQECGIRVVPYTTARIWQEKDRRGQDYLFSKVAKPASVVEKNGKIATEQYGLPCSVLCPATETYQKYEYDMTVNLAAHGFDGVYADQIGAARPRLCYSPNHGHRLADDEAWYKNGQYPLYKRIRDYWKQCAPEKVLTTEDNAEHCVSLFHGLLNWRWMYDNQVPVFPLVYSGRVQFVGLDCVGEEPEAAFSKAATQLINSEQIGWFQHQKLTAPGKHDFRIFIKQLLHLRMAMLPFFNHGIMTRPPKFFPQQKKISRLWGRQGTYYVSSPAVLASSWENATVRATVLINTEAEPQQRTVLLDSPHDKFHLHRFSSDGSEQNSLQDAQQNISFMMPARSCQMWLFAEKEEDLRPYLPETRRIFSQIALFPGEHDPFLIPPDAFSHTKPKNPLDWLSENDMVPISGFAGGANSAINYEILFFGTIDFGDGSARKVEVEFDAPVEHPVGVVSLHLDGIDSPSKIAEFNVGKDFPFDAGKGDATATVLKSEFLVPVSGMHKAVFLLHDSSHCILKKWRVLQS